VHAARPANSLHRRSYPFANGRAIPEKKEGNEYT
jgi:hypothetical protein